MPTLMRNSVLYGKVLMSKAPLSQVVGRILLAYEHLALLQIPVLLPKEHPCHERLPTMLRYGAWVKNELSDHQLRTLAGNGKNLSQMGSAWLILLMGSRFHAPQRSPLKRRRSE